MAHWKRKRDVSFSSISLSRRIAKATQSLTANFLADRRHLRAWRRRASLKDREGTLPLKIFSCGPPNERSGAHHNNVREPSLQPYFPSTSDIYLFNSIFHVVHKQSHISTACLIE